MTVNEEGARVLNPSAGSLREATPISCLSHLDLLRDTRWCSINRHRHVPRAAHREHGGRFQEIRGCREYPKGVRVEACFL